jgi:hypothetical protein
MQKFSPVTTITTEQPTVTMLSHVWFAKDIKTALLAADIIINQWGFTEYHLDIYGALNKAPIYSSECQEILAGKGLAPNVTLRGPNDPGKVLAATWLFLNSSVSEGLPLALGEAALTGAPVVCTDVGASLRVLTHPESNERFSEIVAPNDPLGLARAQINLLAMLGQWTAYANDTPDKPAPILPIKPTKQDVDIITARMYEKTAERRALGMMAREIVQTSFSGERYLREHEQMLWVGKSRNEAYGVRPEAPPEPPPPSQLQVLVAGGAPGQKTYADVVDAQLEKMAHPQTAQFNRSESRAGVSSFTSLYTEDGTVPGVHNPTITPHTSVTRHAQNTAFPFPSIDGSARFDSSKDIPAPLRRAESQKLGFQARMKDREWTRNGGAPSTNRYVPSSLSEVRNASEVGYGWEKTNQARQQVA